MTLRYKIIAGTAALLSLLAIAANADHHKADRKQHNIERLTEHLELTEEQIPQVSAILEDAQAQRKTIGDSYTLNQRKEARMAMRQLHEETKVRMEAVLTAEQSAKLSETMERRSKRREHRREHRRMRQEAQSEG